MNKSAILAAVVGLLAGAIIVGFSSGYAVNNNSQGMMRMMGMNQEVIDQMYPAGHSQMSMEEMSRQLEGLSADNFDKAFIEMMIAHHEGAIDMAVLASQQARHEEIKKLSQDIVSAQSAEIAQMRQWQMDWGYQAAESMHMMH